MSYPAAMSLRMSKTERRLLSTVKRTSEEYGLLEPGDKVLLALSGGKDSYGMAHLLRHLVARLPFELELVIVHLDQVQPGYDGAPLRTFLEGFGVPFKILSEDTYSVVIEHVTAGGTYCSLCSRLRRGILYQAAEDLGCNKVALGHHRDDAIETFLMNLIYAGKLQAMPAKYKTDDGRFDVIRPLIQCDERDLVELSTEQAFPILPCNLCGSQEELKRDKMSELLHTLEKENPHVRSVMMSALSNVSPTHLLDRDVARAWAERDPSIPAKASLAQGQKRPLRTPDVAQVGGGGDVAALGVSGAPVNGTPSLTPGGPRRLPLVG